MNEDSEKSIKKYKNWWNSHSLWWRIKNRFLFRAQSIYAAITAGIGPGEMRMARILLKEIEKNKRLEESLASINNASNKDANTCKHGVRTLRLVCDMCGYFDTSDDDDSEYPEEEDLHKETN